jgi:hypothetical protein
MNIWLPHLKDDPRISRMRKEELHQLTTNILVLKNYGGSDERIDYILDLYEEYRAELEGSTDIPLGQGPSPLKKVIDLDLSDTSVEDYHTSEIIDHDESRQIFFFSDSHASTFYTLQDSKNGSTRAIVCFDAHDDLSEMETLWKGNVFTHLLNAGVIDYLVLVGVANFRISNTLSRLSTEMSRRVLFSTNPTAITSWLKSKQVDEIYLSFDLDVLRTRDERLTAMEYCPFGVLLNAAATNPGQLDLERAKQFAESSIRPVGELGVRNLYHLGEEGPTTQEALDLVREIKYRTTASGIRTGFRTSQGILLGEIVELNGPDLGYRTSTFSLSVCLEWKEGAS